MTTTKAPVVTPVPVNAAEEKTVAKPAPKAAVKKAPATLVAAPAKTVAIKKPSSKTAPVKAAAAPAALKKSLAATVKSPLKATAKTVAAAKADKKVEVKVKKVKQVRDSFTMPEVEYAVLGQVKKTCLKAGFEIKKSDLLRIGVSLIKNLESAQLKTLLAGLTTLKVGRPKK